VEHTPTNVSADQRGQPALTTASRLPDYPTRLLWMYTLPRVTGRASHARRPSNSRFRSATQPAFHPYRRRCISATWLHARPPAPPPRLVVAGRAADCAWRPPKRRHPQRLLHESYSQPTRRRPIEARATPTLCHRFPSPPLPMAYGRRRRQQGRGERRDDQMRASGACQLARKRVCSPMCATAGKRGLALCTHATEALRGLEAPVQFRIDS